MPTKLNPMSAPELPDDVSADYVNEAVEQAHATLIEAPNYERLAAFLNTLREGYLFVDVTGAPKNTKKQGIRIRTTRSTKGQLVLPLFTSMEALREAQAPGAGRKGVDPKGVLTPALEALRMIRTDRFVAAQINPGPRELVILRKYIERLIDGDDVTPELLESLK